MKDQAGFAADYEFAGILIAPGVFTGSLGNGGEEIAILDGTETMTYRSLSNVTLTNREFIRVKVVRTP